MLSTGNLGSYKPPHISGNDISQVFYSNAYQMVWDDEQTRDESCIPFHLFSVRCGDIGGLNSPFTFFILRLPATVLVPPSGAPIMLTVSYRTEYIYQVDINNTSYELVSGKRARNNTTISFFKTMCLIETKTLPRGLMRQYNFAGGGMENAPPLVSCTRQKRFTVHALCQCLPAITVGIVLIFNWLTLLFLLLVKTWFVSLWIYNVTIIGVALGICKPGWCSKLTSPGLCRMYRKIKQSFSKLSKLYYPFCLSFFFFASWQKRTWIINKSNYKNEKLSKWPKGLKKKW